MSSLEEVKAQYEELRVQLAAQLEAGYTTLDHYICKRCGAWVRDFIVHDEWHEQLEGNKDAQ